MISKENYETMKEKYGFVSSWTIWTPAGATPTSNTHDMSWVNDKDLLKKINTGFVFVGYNWSSTHGDQHEGGRIDWVNFHSGYRNQRDFKLRYALQGTRYWGSYITDIIKLYEEVDSNKVAKYLEKHPEVITANIESFKEEISYLGEKPILVALGEKAFELLRDYLGNEYTVVYLTHYSFSGYNKEDYREVVLKTLDNL